MHNITYLPHIITGVSKQVKHYLVIRFKIHLFLFKEMSLFLQNNKLNFWQHILHEGILARTC